MIHKPERYLEGFSMEYIKVMAQVSVSRTCTNCLYYGCNGLNCGNANNNGRLMLAINGGKACGWFWLNQHKYPYATNRQ